MKSKQLNSVIILIKKHLSKHIHVLEIKPYELGSRIREMNAEWRLKGTTDLISRWIFGKAELALWDEPNIEPKRVPRYDVFGL